MQTTKLFLQLNQEYIVKAGTTYIYDILISRIEVVLLLPFFQQEKESEARNSSKSQLNQKMVNIEFQNLTMESTTNKN